MSNWFEQNATKSIVTYTLVVAGVTGISIGVAKVGADYTADIVLGIPDAETPRQLKEVKPGTFWYAKVGTETYRVTVTDVNWLSDSVRAEVRDARSVSVSGPPELAPIE